MFCSGSIRVHSTAALASAQADSVLAHATLQRQTELRTKAVVAGQDYDVAMANAMKADAAVRRPR